MHHLKALETNERPIGNGRSVFLYPLYAGARLGIGDTGTTDSFDDVWDYQDVCAALEAYLTWDGTGEPEGWYRHPATARRRTGGDPAKEFIMR